MKEKIKSLRLNITISALISVIIGVLLLIYPTESLNTIGRVIGAIVVLSGIFIIIGQILEFGLNAMSIVVGGVLAIVGIWIFSSPAAIVSIIPIAIGVVLVAHGLQDLGLAIEATKFHAPSPWVPYVFAVVNIGLGALCVAGAFNIVTIATRIIGVMLVYDGISDMVIVRKVRKASAVVDSYITREEDI